MSKLIYISRNYVEFGPFTSAELIDFEKRGIVKPHDFARFHSEDAWHSATDFASSLKPAAKAPAAKKTAAPAKKTAAKKAPAKK